MKIHERSSNFIGQDGQMSANNNNRLRIFSHELNMRVVDLFVLWNVVHEIHI